MTDEIAHFTTSGIAQGSGVPERTIREWAEKGLLDCTKDSVGRRLFDQSAIEKAAQLREARAR